MLASPALCQNVPNWNWIWQGDSSKRRIPSSFDSGFCYRKMCVGRLLITADDNFSAYLNEGKKAVVQGNDWTTFRRSM